MKSIPERAYSRTAVITVAAVDQTGPLSSLYIFALNPIAPARELTTIIPLNTDTKEKNTIEIASAGTIRAT